MIQNKRNYIIGDNLTYAWNDVISLLLERGAREIIPLFVTVKIRNNVPKEDEEARQHIDNLLNEHDKYSCNTVANTIFPISLWNPQKPREELYYRFNKIYPKIKQYSRKGRYFDRLINYTDQFHNSSKINQLERIITTRMEKGNKRRSALQASVINPYIDHPDQRRPGFPCLQQISFTPLDNKLSVTGFYPLQYIFDRAYGNYLGLYRLGYFIAHELKLELAEMTCIATIAALGDINKTDKALVRLNEYIKERKRKNGNPEGA